MALPSHLQVALKEWASVCDALAGGRQILILRKGGILDRGGVFELEERQFLLFPTYLHQKADLLKPSEHAALQTRDAEPAQVTFTNAAVVTDVLKLSSRAEADALDHEHIWTPRQIDMRFSYRPASPLYLVLLRVYRLSRPTTIANTPVYGGCRSWVPLDQAIETSGAIPSLSDQQFSARHNAVLNAIAR